MEFNGKEIAQILSQISLIVIMSSYSLFIGKIRNSPSVNRVQPPGYVFGPIWAILFVLLGFSFAYAGTSSGSIVIYIFLDISLLIWPILFQKSTRLALYSINWSIMMVIFAMIRGPIESQYLLIPLLVWLNFASNLNYTIAIKDPTNVAYSEIEI